MLCKLSSVTGGRSGIISPIHRLGPCTARECLSILTGFLHNPRVPLDNNLAERAVRTPVLGRKNHLGSHSERGAKASSLFYSLLGSCRLVGVSPNQYLTVLVERRLRDHTYVMLPHEFAAELAAAVDVADPAVALHAK